MASIQCGRKDEKVMSHKEKVTLDKLIDHAFAQDDDDIDKQALAVVAQHEGIHTDLLMCARADPQVGFPKPGIISQITIIGAALKNQTKGSFSVFKTHKWTGHIVTNFTHPLKTMGAFSMSAIQNKGAKAAVVYSGSNKAGVECAWLLAFGRTMNHGSTIYAECGPKRKFNNINWEQLEKKLDGAGPLTKPADKETGTGVHATIVGIGGKYAVAAAFTG